MAADNGQQKVKSFVLRIDAQTMSAIEEWAADEFRSVNGQLQWLIADALKRSGRMTAKKRNG
ncbi:MAG: DNA-binding protein [Bacteroidales bacterium]|nr:DNA-binding protein [Bacteroidales bacterium]